MEHTALTSLSEEQLLKVLLAVAVTLTCARVGGGLARRLRQPEVLGELFAGLLLGPSVLGVLAPEVRRWLFLEPAVGRSISAFSWMGAVLLLLIAGLEVDLTILARRARPGTLAAVGAMVPAVVGGVFFARWAFPGALAGHFFLGIVLSVTAVSVVAKILIESETLRRDFAQVLLAAGIASEIVVWPLVGVASSIQTGSPAVALKAAGFAVAFLMAMFVVGRPFVYWLMRRVSDAGQVSLGPLSLVIVLALLAAGLTARLGLHPLLGAFMVGVVLAASPRTSEPLLASIQSLTTGLFAPLFFATAGMRVDVLQLKTPAAWGVVAALFAVSAVLKVLPSTLGAKLGGLSFVESALVGVGMNLKGGTDVIVAIIGVELGLLSSAAYTAYAVVALLTVMVSPPLLAFLQRRALPTEEEKSRLDKEEATRRSYLPSLERVLLPRTPQAQPELAEPVVRALAEAKQQQSQILDVTELVAAAAPPESTGRVGDAEVTVEHVEGAGLREVLEASRDHQLIALGAKLDGKQRRFSFGRLQDAIIQGASSDILLVVQPDGARPSEPASRAGRILVPVTGFEYSMAASDIAAFLARASGSELVLFHAMPSALDAGFWRDSEQRRLEEASRFVLDEVEFRVGRLDVKVQRRVVVAEEASQAILRELRRRPYDWVVLGGRHRGGHRRIALGASLERVIRTTRVPALLLLTSGERASK